MTDLLTAQQMRTLEGQAMASGIVTGADLMERAGRGVVEAIFQHWPELAAMPGRAVVLCGPGNNGGDGFVIARLLKGWGWSVDVVALTPASATPDAAAMRALWDGPVRLPGDLDFADLDDAPPHGRPLVIDAMFGTGLSRPVARGVWGLLDVAQDAGCRVVAVDILSGLCADSGRVLAEGGYLDRPADLTVTFETARTGHHLDAGGALGGALAVAPIGLDRWRDDLMRRAGDAVAELAGPVGMLAKTGGHKYRHGHALILAGGPGRGGAGRLAARGALRIGAGLVTLGCPGAALAENAARLDAVMLRPVEGEAGLRDLLSDPRINALCLGPGLGTDRADLVAAALSFQIPRHLPPELVDADGQQVADWLHRYGHRPACVLDADALTILAARPDLFGSLHPACVLTPHAGEFARLFPDLAERLAAPPATGPAWSKLDATRAAAERAGCTVLFKGPDTVIAAPDGRAVIASAHYDRAVPWLATAGAGDVLSGFITGLLARGLGPMQAAEAAAWLHVDCARRFGPGLIAEDLPEALPGVFRDLAL